MKIDEDCINHNVARLAREITSNMYENGDNPDWYKMSLAEIAGINDLAEALKEVLKS